jgi:hypothetical protein
MALKRKDLVRVLLFLPILFTVLLVMPVSFAGKKSATDKILDKKEASNLLPDMMHLSNRHIDNETISWAFVKMQLDELGLSEQAFNYAIKGLNSLLMGGEIVKDQIISIIDFSQPSSKKRLFVIDLTDLHVVYNTYVAHGVNSGKAFANNFSNSPSSYKSSLGFYETGKTYMGGHGYSLKLNGLEPGINDNAEKRAIVIHAADYVNESLIRTQGYIGRSWGCPALPNELYKPVIDKIKDGTCLFIYSPESSYLQKSEIINS